MYCSPDPQSIETAVRAVMDDPDARSRMGRDNQLRAQSFFTWEAVCAAYEDVLRGALTARGTRS